ncbi:preprotein translocase subunit SecA [Desulfuribacillus alkaliarsenatis]|uniref:Protein translocase subunit SecA n=1 Tax=Desulfuribacillus alkaliarsenatis TaxID=766136 RepID=A0A1E5G470_9FIRM|nr:preprotein translocase subunit SecA [Desulfuribacillus alkaliarsenatis]OEF97804.1 preprotein translocase subunit SecA [Desulfuribacillus alkaliarsenatis]
MVVGLFKKLFGDGNARDVKKLQKIVDKINAFEPEISELSDADLQSKTDKFKQEYEQGKSLDDILPEAYAVVREASKRVLGLRHFDVQLMGGIVLHQHRIAEMRTGEGKTLMATLPAYLNAITGKGVHVITVNDYLAKRDSEWMGQIHQFLGLTVGLNVHGLSHEQKQEAYRKDITYGTNNEFGFDYLRDNMVLYKEQLVQRPLYYAIIDEVDSILIDEARTPLIISGKGEKSADFYNQATRFVRKLAEEDYTLDEKAKSVSLTDEGVTKAEQHFNIENLYDDQNLTINHQVLQALKAKVIMKRDVDYVVQDGEVVIVDEFTGRLMQGRRFSDGLHQAIESKEGLKTREESKTLASITIQNYFRMYEKLAGMTGTAKTEEEEFMKIYSLDVVTIPTNRPMIREDMPDVVYKTLKGKVNAVVEEIAARHLAGQPVLVGTISIENSELFSQLLTKKGIPHSVLNAKYHEQEAEIVAKAGQKGAVTIATNMAGRGTDIVLGADVHALGGLHIIGTERHESRRIDNQLRGRAGRQGDPGSSQFFVSLEDDLMRLFGGEAITGMMEKIGFDEDQPLESSMLSRAIEKAQEKVETNNFQIRRHILQYDDVMNKQREIMYKQRREVLENDSIRDIVVQMMEDVTARLVEIYCPAEEVPEDWDMKGLHEGLMRVYLKPEQLSYEELDGMRFEREPEGLIEFFNELIEKIYADREQDLGEPMMRELEKVIVLRSVDSKWMNQIDAMDQLRQGIHLRAYGQRDPVMEYNFEGFEMFEEMIFSIKEEVSTHVMKAQVQGKEQLERKEVAKGQTASHGAIGLLGGAQGPMGQSTSPRDKEVKRTPYVNENKVGRNDPCPCGSGKKHKKCCG